MTGVSIYRFGSCGTFRIKGDGRNVYLEQKVSGWPWSWIAVGRFDRLEDAEEFMFALVRHRLKKNEERCRALRPKAIPDVCRACGHLDTDGKCVLKRALPVRKGTCSASTVLTNKKRPVVFPADWRVVENG